MKRPSTAPAPAGDFALERFVPYRLSVITNTISAAIAADYGARYGVTIPEWRALAALGRFAPLSAGEIAARTAMDKVQVSRALARLIADGLVARRAHGEDRRRAALELTAAGRRLHDGIVPLARAKEAELLAPLDAAARADLERMLDLLARQAARLAGLDDLFSAPRAELPRRLARAKASSRRRSRR